MKSVSLIPFIVGLIGYDQCVRDSPELWKHGPEYSFRFQVSASLSMEPTHEVRSNVSAILKCRPFASEHDGISNALRCHIGSAEIDNYETNKSSIPAKIVRPEPPGPFEITGFTFDIIFGKARVNEIRIHQATKNYRMNMYRDMVSQLGIAFNGFGQEKARLTARDYASSTVGECDTKFEVFKRLKYPKREWDSQCKKMHLEIYGTNYPSVMIEKTRNMDNCTKKTPYFFGGEDVASTAPFLTAETNTSVSGIMIAPQSFESRTIRTGILTVTKSEQLKKFPVHEEISLRLISIEPASMRFQELEVYGITGLLADDLIITSNDEVYRSPK